MKIIGVTFEPRATFEDADAEAGAGYQNDLLLRDAAKSFSDFLTTANLDQPIHFSHSLNGIAASAFLANSRHLRVLDVGGALGHFLYVAKQNFGDSLEFDWTVLETQMYTEYGGQHIKNECLKFCFDADDISCKSFDIIHFSGSLQYLKDYRSIFEWKAVRDAPFIFISRTAYADEETAYLQKVIYDEGLVQYAGRVFAKSDLFGLFELTHVLHASWADMHTMNGLAAQPLQVPSMLWRRRTFMPAVRSGASTTGPRNSLLHKVRDALSGRPKSLG